MGLEQRMNEQSEYMIIIPRKGSEKRFNPNHGKDGRFTSGGAGASYQKADNGTQQLHKQAIEKLSKAEYSEGTYDIDTMKQVTYDSGYQVTFCQIGDNYSDSEYAEKVNEFLGVSSDGKTRAGKFEGTPEISFHVDSKDVAIDLGKKYNQISVWDWKAEDEIDTGGTGRRKDE